MNNNEKYFKNSKSLIIYDFLNVFNLLEKLVKEIFKKNIEYLSNNDKNFLYFYYGSKINIYLEFQDEKIVYETHRFDENEKFKDITFNQIIKINRARDFIKELNLEIQSVQNKTYYSTSDICLKLISMRNKLAHEVCDCDFKSSDIVEKLSDENISKYLEKYNYDFDVSKMKDDTKEIFSNIIYANLVLEKFKEL